jgi:hypothetical protein
VFRLGTRQQSEDMEARMDGLIDGWMDGRQKQANDKTHRAVANSSQHHHPAKTSNDNGTARDGTMGSGKWNKEQGHTS